MKVVRLVLFKMDSVVVGSSLKVQYGLEADISCGMYVIIGWDDQLCLIRCITAVLIGKG